MGARKFDLLNRLTAWRREREAVPAPLIPSRDLPLPRSPEAIPEEALVFALGQARRSDARARAEAPGIKPGAIATGAELRAMLERFERGYRRKLALDQADQARSRLVERLAAGRDMPARKPALRLVGAGAPADPRLSAAEEERRIEKAMDEALASALDTLKRISALPKA